MLALLERADAAQLLPAADSSSATLRQSLAGELTQVRVDLTQYAETYLLPGGRRGGIATGTVAPRR